MANKYDFGGYVTRNDLLCADGRTIRANAFKDCDGVKVPLVWQHVHDDPTNVIGHALLENRDDGVYGYCRFNDTEKGRHIKKSVMNGDIDSLSIYANHLKHSGRDVVHGVIREVSLVLAGANPGAFIDSLILEHSEEPSEIEGIIYTEDEDVIEIAHDDIDDENSLEHAEPEKKSEDDMAETKDNNEKTVGDVFDTLNEEQKKAVEIVIGAAIQNAKNDKNDSNEEEDNMKHNVFDTTEEYAGYEDVLTHSDIQAIFSDAKKTGSLKDSFLEHTATYGIEDIDYLFPEAKSLNTPPEFIKRDTDWVADVMGSVHHTPFSRIKSVFADITEDEARAKGYIKGNLKKEEVFSLLKRTTTPTTIYKKQKLDRDDIIDITDFDVVAWIKSEMRIMLDEEIARAILVGDGRSASEDDKISELNIRPIYTDADLFSIKVQIGVTSSDTVESKARKFIKAAVRARKNYKGTGNPTLYTTEDMLTEMLLLEDTNQHRLYDTEQILATALRVKKIVTVPVLEGLSRTTSAGKTYPLAGLIVNLTDYNVGADKGGAISMFDDFDIDYNQQKYLIETRCSGALTKPFSALVLEFDSSAS